MMRWREVRAVAAGFAVCLAAGSAWADMVVVRSSSPGLKPGQVVASGASITLPAASQVMLLTRDGRTVALKGPFSGPVAEPAAAAGAGDAKTVSVISRLLTASNADTSALGVTRAVEFGSPYAMSTDGGTHCQVASEKPWFEREIGNPEEHVTITTASGAKETVSWADGEGALDWPAKLPFAAGTYSIRLDAQPKPVSLTVQLVPAEIKGATPIAVWMAEHNCSSQAIRMLSSLH